MKFYFRFRLWPISRRRHLITYRHTKSRVNRATDSIAMTSCQFSRWRTFQPCCISCTAVMDHPRRVVVGVIEYRRQILDWSDILQFYILVTWLENACSRLFWVSFGGTFPQMMSLIVLTPKRTVFGLNHVIWAIKREYQPRGSSWALEREKRTVWQDRKKVTKGLYFTYVGRSSHWSDLYKNCVVVDVLDVITCTKFRNEIFRGFDVTGGRIFHFPIDFWKKSFTTVQRYCAACDLI